jgi:hypothetical protein
MSTLRGKNVEFVNVKAGDASSIRSDLKVNSYSYIMILFSEETGSAKYGPVSFFTRLFLNQNL